MRILNDELAHGELTPVLFIFPPVEIPVSEEGVVTNESTNSHYASVVYDIANGSLAVLEYGLKVFHAVASYNQRHEDIGRIEVLLTRHPDNRFKMNIGNTDQRFDISEDVRVEGQKLQDTLIEYYKSLTNYRVHDL